VSDVVLDASALLALAQNEPGAAIVEGVLPCAIIGTVNLSEAVAKLSDRGVPEDAAWTTSIKAVARVVTFDETLARLAAGLRARTRAHGLSFADRACLALALNEKAEAYTADRRWHALDIGVTIRLIR
jgi:PIN domain nuclease of toxin-antitoxin system